MPKLIVKSGYTKDVNHFVNNLEYSGNKIAEQHVTFTDGTTKTYDGCKRLDLDEIGRENIAEIYLQFKDGIGRTVSVESYETKTKDIKTITVERVIETIPDKETTIATLPRELQDLNFFKYMNYIGERPGVVKENDCGLFSLSGNIAASEAEQLARDDNFNRGWMHIISMDSADAQRLGYDNRAAWRDLIISKAPDLAKAYNISLENLRIYGGFHANTDNPHVHINFYSTNKAEAYVKDLEKASKKVKSIFTNAIFKDDVSEIKQTISQARDEMSINLMKALAVNNVSSEIKNKLVTLSQSLPDKGKHQYQFLTSETKELVKEILSSSLKQPELQPLYDNYMNAQKEYAKVYADNPVVIARQLELAQDKLINVAESTSWRKLHNMIVKIGYALKDNDDSSYLPEPITKLPEAEDNEIIHDDFVPAFNASAQEPNQHDYNPNTTPTESFFDTKFNFDTVSEKASALLLKTRKLIHRDIANCILTDKTQKGSELHELIKSDAPAPVIFKHIVDNNGACKTAIDKLSVELSNKTTIHKKADYTSNEIYEKIFSNSKNNPFNKYIDWCKSNYDMLAAGQIRKHCSRLNRVSGRNITKVLSNNFEALEPQFIELYSLNKRLKEIKAHEIDEEKVLSEDDKLEIKELEAQINTRISNISNSYIIPDKFFNKYSDKIFNHTFKHFEPNVADRINNHLKKDLVNANLYSCPGSNISFFTDILPQQYLRQICQCEAVKEKYSELNKEISSLINNQLLQSPTLFNAFKETQQSIHRKDEINLKPLHEEILKNNPQISNLETELHKLMADYVNTSIPAQMQSEVKVVLDKAFYDKERSLPWLNSIYYKALDLPTTVACACLTKNEDFDKLKDQIKDKLTTALSLNESTDAQNTISKLMVDAYQSKDTNNNSQINELSQQFFSVPEITEAKQKLFESFSGTFKKFCPNYDADLAFNKQAINSSFGGVAGMLNFYVDKLPNLYLSQLGKTEPVKVISKEIIKSLASAINSNLLNNEELLSAYKNAHESISNKKEVNLSKIYSLLVNNKVEPILLESKLHQTMQEQISIHIPNALQSHVRKELEKAFVNHDRSLPMMNFIYNQAKELPDTVAISILHSSKDYESLKTVLRKEIYQVFGMPPRNREENTLFKAMLTVKNATEDEKPEALKNVIHLLLGTPNVSEAKEQVTKSFVSKFEKLLPGEDAIEVFEKNAIFSDFGGITGDSSYYINSMDEIMSQILNNRAESLALKMFRGLANMLYDSSLGSDNTDKHKEQSLTVTGNLTQTKSKLKSHHSLGKSGFDL